ncbi:MAG: hypothetical protein LIO58_02550 [Oscillospiraceae bacterium]|nr:hypothetical protein [Oscillospiraceae bacterium]
MIIDIKGTILTPGKKGEHCRGNGAHYENGKRIECCCDECDFSCCCLPEDHKWYLPFDETES